MLLFLDCQSLISNGERYEEETFLGRARLETLRSLCRMCPNQILMIRLKCVSLLNHLILQQSNLNLLNLFLSGGDVQNASSGCFT